MLACVCVGACMLGSVCLHVFMWMCACVCECMFVHVHACVLGEVGAVVVLLEKIPVGKMHEF